MIKRAILVILALATAAAGIFWVVRGRKPTVSEAKAEFCTHLKNYGETVASLRSINQNTTVEELREAQKAVEESWNELQAASLTLEEARIDALQASYSDLEDTIQRISGDMKLDEARVEIYLAALNTLANTLAEDQMICRYSLLNLRENAELP